MYASKEEIEELFGIAPMTPEERQQWLVRSVINRETQRHRAAWPREQLEAFATHATEEGYEGTGSMTRARLCEAYIDDVLGQLPEPKYAFVHAMHMAARDGSNTEYDFDNQHVWEYVVSHATLTWPDCPIPE